MNQKRTLLNKKGNRNIFCPYYGDCLDYVIKQSWKDWDCCDCDHKLAQEPWVEAQLTNSDAFTDYDLFAEIYFKVK